LSTLRRGTVAGLAAIAAAVAVAVSAWAATPQNVTVTAGKPGEFQFTLSKKTVKKGVPVVFKVTNKGTVKHDFKVGGKKTISLATGKTATLRVTFAKVGKFAYLCTLPGHAAGGMKGTLTVVR
jgi:cytochrome c oxidase subunit 2